MARFAFRFHHLYRVLGLPFGVTPGTSLVEVVDDHLVVRFGPWYLRTPVTNLVSCERSGPYSVWVDVASLLGLPEGTVKSRIRSGLKSAVVEAGIDPRVANAALCDL